MTGLSLWFRAGIPFDFTILLLPTYIGKLLIVESPSRILSVNSEHRPGVDVNVDYKLVKIYQLAIDVHASLMDCVIQVECDTKRRLLKFADGIREVWDTHLTRNRADIWMNRISFLMRFIDRDDRDDRDALLKTKPTQRRWNVAKTMPRVLHAHHHPSQSMRTTTSCVNAKMKKALRRFSQWPLF